MGKSPELQRMLLAAAWAQALAHEERQAVLEALQERRFDAGATVWHEGAPATHWMGVVAGMVKVDSIDAEGRGTTFICVSSGGWLGEGSCIKGEPLRFEVTTLHKSHLCFLPRAVFQRLLATSLPFNHFIIDQLNARLGQFLALTEHYRVHDTVAQVAHCVAELFNPQLNPQPPRDIRLSLAELGRLCGLSRQVASRALHRLEEQGLVHLHHHGVEVLDVLGLRRFARLH